jgi:Ran GTPase-activating protein (RanGAP) involved in mRNA processing and transport
VSPKFERINISNNKITSEAFKRIIPSITTSKSLKLFELRYNAVNSGDVDYLAAELRRSKNEALLYVELSGNKIKKESVDAL